MKKIFKSSLAWLLVLCMCLSNVSIVLAARATEADDNKPETIWRGDEVTAEITAGKNGYTFVSVYRSPAHAYEFSNHALVSGGNVDIPQLFVMADASKDYTWSPDGKYSFGVSNYEVLYCCDAETGLDDGIYYKRLNLEDSSYYDSDSAAHIRAILTNSYPYVSLEQMKANLIKAGVEGAENLDRAEILSAVQGAVWNFANGAAYEYKMSYNVTATPKYGIPMHDYTAELNPEVKAVIEKLGNAYGSSKNRKELADVGARVNAVIDYLMNLETVYAEKNQVIITDLEIVGANANTVNGEYLATVRVNLNNGGSSEKDNIKLDIYVDGVLATSRPVYREITSYDINISAKAGQTIKAVVSGTQIAPQDVYLYEPEGGRDVSQCLVGIASGETNVYAESQVVLNAETLVPVDKFATPLNNSFQTTVTLQVPGDSQDLGVDIIYVAGAYLDKNEVEKDLMITSLYSTFVEIVGAGVPVSFGFVPFSYDDKPVMELTTYKTLEDLEANFRKDLVQAIEDASGAYGGENMENALQIAKNMFAESPLANHPERQHLVLVSSGHTYNFNVGENNDIFSTVPVAIAGSEKAGKYFYGFKAWMQARNKNPNNYPIPKPFSTYNDYRDWDAFWKVIDEWAKADVAAGDKVVYNISDTTDPSFTFNDWYTTQYLGSDSTHNAVDTFKSFGLYIHTATELALKNGYDFANAPMSAHGSLLGTTIDNVPAAAQHAISYERAMWEASNFIDEHITGAGINFYPIYNQMKPYYTNGVFANNQPNPDGKQYNHGVTWTQQYIGHSFMNMLARNAGRGLEAVNNSTAEDKAFFDPIKKQILYTCVAGSYVEDYIGYDPLIGNFEFINDAERITLYVGEYTYVTEMTSFVKDEDGKIISASYSFTKPGNDEATFWLDYDYGNGTTTEMFRWTFGEDASLVNRLSLVYDLQLIDMVTEVGSYWIDTNLSATLYPVISTVVEDEESSYVYGDPIIFPVPEVQYLVEKLDFEVTKMWDDDNDRDGIRPESIVIKLYVNDVEVKTATLTKDNETATNTWKHIFADVIVYKLPGEDVNYRIEEVVDEESGYTAAVDGLTITNVHVPEKVEVSGSKTWDDDNDRDGIRPESITINLLANGEKVQTITVTAEDEWAWSFNNLNKYENGVEIVYTITEEAVEGYETVIDGYNVTNVHAPEKVNISGGKIWDDDNDRDGIRPESITINLLANGEKVQTITVTAEDEWAWSFENLNKYENGAEIVYTITEESVDGYEANVDDFNITNVHATQKISISVEKIWDDDDNFENARPESITIRLYANGEEIAAQVISALENWEWTFDNLNKFAEGEEIVYTISEDEVEGYVSEISGNANDGFEVVNTYVVEFEEEDPPLTPPMGDEGITTLLVVAVVSALISVALIARRKKID